VEQQTSLEVAQAPSHLYVSAHYDWRSGWRLRVSSAPAGARQRPATDYDALSAEELVDVVLAELELRLNRRIT